MSSGRYCVIRELGLVKGGKGMKHHDVVLTLTPKGLCAGLLGVANSLAAGLRDKLRRPEFIPQFTRHSAGTIPDSRTSYIDRS